MTEPTEHCAVVQGCRNFVTLKSTLSKSICQHVNMMRRTGSTWNHKNDILKKLLEIWESKLTLPSSKTKINTTLVFGLSKYEGTVKSWLA